MNNRQKLATLLVGICFGFLLSISIPVEANREYRNYDEVLLEEIRDNGDDILGKMETIIDRLDAINGSIRRK